LAKRSQIEKWTTLNSQIAKTRKALADVETIEDAASIADYAEAVRYAAKQAGASIHLQNAAAEVRLRAERRSGQLQREAQKRGELAAKGTGGAPLDPLAPEGPRGTKTLRDLSVSTGTSVKELKTHRAVAAVPDETFEDYITEMQEKGKEITTKGVTSLVNNRIAKNAGGLHEGIDLLSRADISGEGWTLLLGDAGKRMAELPDASVNLVVTDPPYGKDYLGLWNTLGLHATRLLVPGGVLFARSGHLFLPYVIRALENAGLSFGWIYSEPLPGSNVRFQGRKIAVSWQPWVAFSNGPWPSGSIDWHPDTLTESPRTKVRYVWEQKWDVAAEIIATFAQPGHDVLDPFAGTGTYGVAALSVGCRWTGIEKDMAGHAVAADRLQKIR
jgi:site-specific DNA-methyltransferase (adenine-specific)